jgi:hypothetical protein
MHPYKGHEIKKTSSYSFQYSVSQERMTPALCFRVIHGRNCTMSTEMSFFVMLMAFLQGYRYYLEKGGKAENITSEKSAHP